MSKELETLEKLKEHLKYEWIDNLSNTEYYDILKQALQRLESIDNAEPSEALEETLRDIAYDLENDDNPFLRDRYYGLLDLKQALLKAQKDRKALEIIKPYLKLVGNCLQVRVPLVDGGNLLAHVKKITNEEELDTLKEVLE